MSRGERTIAGVRLLGGVHAVATDGSVVEIPSASQRRLLSMLALHAPRRLRSEWIADVLDISPGALRTTVSRLRSVVGSSVLQTSKSGYSLHAEVDAAQFCAAIVEAASKADRVDALERALAIWVGPALEEFRGEEWADGEIARLTELHAASVDDYADALIASRRSADAVAVLEQQIALYPFRDRSRGLLIRSLAGSGRQAEALRAFQAYRTLLGDEVGTDPSPDVVRIERRVATGWDGAERDRDDSTASDTVTIPIPTGLRFEGPFIGRTGELDVLAGELVLAREGGLRSVVLDGEAGIGKTSLLAAFARSVVSAGSATVLYARCDETSVPLQPFRSVLANCVEHAPTDLLAENVARCGGDLARICPTLTARVPTAPAPTASDDATERFLTFEAAADLLRRVSAGRTLVLLLDDLQWAEPTALLLLRHLAGALADSSVLLVVSIRLTGEYESNELRAALVELERGASHRVELGGFSDGDLIELVSYAAPVASADDKQRAAVTLRTDTAGNALFASQLIRHWIDAGRLGPPGADTDPHDIGDDVPLSLRDIVWSRVHALGGDAESVLTAAAVLGPEFRDDVLVDMVDLPESVVVGVLDGAVRGGLLADAESPDPAKRFTHALVANALYADLGRSRRVRWHGQAARALERRAGGLRPDVVVQLVRHCARAGWLVEAQQWSMRAADYALEHLAPAEAAQHYRVAFDMADALHAPDAERAELLVRLGDAQHRAGDPQALDTLERGAALARAVGARDALVHAALAANRGFMRIDERAPGYLEIVEAAVAVADPSDVASYAQLVALLAQSLLYTPQAERRVQFAHQALELASQHADATLVARVAPAVLNALWAPGDAGLRTRLAAAAVSSAEASGDPALQFGARHAAWNVAIESADQVTAARSLAALRSIASARAEPHLRWITGLCDTFEATMSGRLETAETLAASTLELGMAIGAPDAFTFFAGQAFVIGTFAGRHAELFPLVEQAAHDNPGVRAFELAYAVVCQAVGRDDVARRILHEGMAEDLAGLPLDNIWMTSIIGYAVLAIELRDGEAAEQLLPVIAPFVDTVAFNGVTSQGPIAAYVGKLASLLDRHDLAEESLQAALGITEAFGWTYHRATTLFALAQARHRRIGALDAEGRAWLAESSELCRAGGYRSWIAQIEALESVA